MIYSSDDIFGGTDYERTIRARKVIWGSYERSTNTGWRELSLEIFGRREGSHFGARMPKMAPFWTQIGRKDYERTIRAKSSVEPRFSR